jgi:hypothetical protein
LFPIVVSVLTVRCLEARLLISRWSKIQRKSFSKTE